MTGENKAETRMGIHRVVLLEDTLGRAGYGGAGGGGGLKAFRQTM